MKIKIKEYRRGDKSVPVVRGFFPQPNLRVKPGEIYECQSEEEYKMVMGTGLVEVAEGEVTPRLIERMEILEGKIERNRDTNMSDEQYKQMAEQQAAILENARLREALENVSERLAALEEKPKRRPGRPKKEAANGEAA